MDKIGETIRAYDLTAADYSRTVRDMHPEQDGLDFMRAVDQSDYPIGSPTLPTWILDLGCGSGRDARIFSEYGFKNVNVVGIDLSEGMLGVAVGEAPKASFARMDIRNLGFANESFDGIWACASLSHLPRKDISQCLGGCSKVLKPNGHLFVGVKEGAGESFDIDCRYAGDVKKFYTYFRQGEMESFLKDSGFRVLHSRIYHIVDGHRNHPEVRILAQKFREADNVLY